jgi:hypothetical protein
MLLKNYFQYPVVCYSIDNILTKEECNKWIEGLEFTPATINDNGIQVIDLNERFCDRCFLDDSEKTTMIWNRIKKTFPESEDSPIGLNPRLRFLKYSPGNFFRPHYDQESHRVQGQHSRWTVQLYFNDDFEGGETVFIGETGSWKVPYKPKTGSVLIFDQELLHEGAEVKKGIKYSARTDIMFLD